MIRWCAALLVLASVASADPFPSQSSSTLSLPVNRSLLELNADWSAIERIDVLVRDGGMPEPTGGVVHGGDFVFVSRSRWTDFDEQGASKSAAPAPAVISRLLLLGAPAVP